MTWPNIMFTRGLTDADALFDWVNKTSGEGFAANAQQAGPLHRLRVDRRLRRQADAHLVADRAVPDPLGRPSASAKEATVLEEEVEVAHHGFTSRTAK